MDEDDARLLSRIQQGDAESFGVLYDRTRGWLLSFVIVPRVGAAAAEDVLAETYRTALARVGDFTWRGVGLLHWLAAIARRKALERQRGAARDAARLVPLAGLLDVPEDLPTVETEMIRRETLAAVRERVRRVLAELPPRYARALTLRLLEGHDRAACAAALEVSPATFDVVLYRATRAFARCWRREEPQSAAL